MDTLIDLVIGFARENRGYMRSAIRRERGAPSASPIRSAGREVINACRGVVPKIRLGQAVVENAYLFGMQTIYAVAGHSATNDPGPFLLDDPELPVELGSVISAMWGAPRR